MASKQLGKLRQWAGEVISSREKTLPTEDFMELERDVEIRRNGLEKLQMVVDDFHAALSRKKFSEALSDPEKVLAIDALGIVMIGHGEELGRDSTYGSSLISLGRAHCRIAALQDTYSLTLSDTYLAFLKQSVSDLSDYAAQRKKFDSRRLAYDAAISKAEKTYKKEKDKKDAEEELQTARLRFEETAQDVRARMHAIQASEALQLRELTNFLDLEIKHVAQYLDILMEVKQDWVNVSDIPSRENRPELHSRSLSRVSLNIDDAKISSPSTSRPSLGLASRFNSIRSFRSGVPTKSPKVTSTELDPEVTDEEESPNGGEEPTSLNRSRSKSQSAKGVSRPTSRQRKRSDSAVTAGGRNDDDDSDQKEKEKKKKSGMAGWVGSVTGRGRNKVADKDKFASLADEDDDDDESDDDLRPRSAMSNRSGKSEGKSRKIVAVSTSVHSPHVTRKRSMRGKQRKIMKALYAFSGQSGELSFEADDEIVVLNEVVDDWWMGELDGKTGLFPANYTVPVEGTDGIKAYTQALPSRPKHNHGNGSSSHIGKSVLGLSSSRSQRMKDEGRANLLDADGDELSPETERDGLQSSDDDHHPFADRHQHISKSNRQPVQDGYDAESIQPLSEDDYDGEAKLVLHDLSPSPSLMMPHAPIIPMSTQVTRSSFNDSNSRDVGSSAATASISSSGSVSAPSTTPSFTATKRAPPPVPPPRRPSSNNVAPPPLPARNVLGSRTQSASSIPSTHSVSTMSTLSSTASSAPINLHDSPFISQSELSFDAVALSGKDRDEECKVSECRCTVFRQNPFQPNSEGVCTNCFHQHA